MSNLHCDTHQEYLDVCEYWRGKNYIFPDDYKDRNDVTGTISAGPAKHICVIGFCQDQQAMQAAVRRYTQEVTSIFNRTQEEVQVYRDALHKNSMEFLNKMNLSIPNIPGNTEQNKVGKRTSGIKYKVRLRCDPMPFILHQGGMRVRIPP